MSVTRKMRVTFDLVFYVETRPSQRNSNTQVKRRKEENLTNYLNFNGFILVIPVSLHCIV